MAKQEQKKAKIEELRKRLINLTRKEKSDTTEMEKPVQLQDEIPEEEGEELDEEFEEMEEDEEIQPQNQNIASKRLQTPQKPIQSVTRQPFQQSMQQQYPPQQDSAKEQLEELERIKQMNSEIMRLQDNGVFRAELLYQFIKLNESLARIALSLKT